MKRSSIIFVVAITLALMALEARVEILHSRNKRQIKDMELVLFDLVVTDSNRVDIKIKEWHLFIDALIMQESGGKEDAVGLTNDIGVLQITPIYVEEVNRVLGEKRYTLQDRYDRYKSIEMFNIMNDKYNPERCFNKAIQLHNPRAPKSYRISVLQYYYEMQRKHN
jgi:hypothetical protein